jgi:hypothetical protein
MFINELLLGNSGCDDKCKTEEAACGGGRAEEDDFALGLEEGWW